MSISFNGSNTKLTWSGNVTSSFPITMFGWIKPVSAATSNMAFGVADFGADDELMAYADGAGTAKARAFARVDGGSTAASSAESISAAWKPFMVVFTNSLSRTVYYGSGASGSDTTSSSNVLSTYDRFVIGCRGKDDSLWFNGEIAEVAVWTSPLGSTEWTSLSGGAEPETVSNGTLWDSWSLIDSSSLTGTKGHTLTAANASTGGTHPISRSGGGASAAVSATTTLPAFSGSAQVAPETSLTVTTALPAFSGGASMASASATLTATTSLPSYSGGATGDTSSGTLTLPVLKNNTGTVLANETGATVHVYAVSTGNKVVTKTGQTTNASGVMTVTDALIVGGTQYRVVVVLGSGAEGLDKVTAS